MYFLNKIHNSILTTHYTTATDLAVLMYGGGKSSSMIVFSNQIEFDKSINELLKLIIEYPDSQEAKESKVLLNSSESSSNINEIVEKVLEIIKENLCVIYVDSYPYLQKQLLRFVNITSPKSKRYKHK